MSIAQPDDDLNPNERVDAFPAETSNKKVFTR